MRWPWKREHRVEKAPAVPATGDPLEGILRSMGAIPIPKDATVGQAVSLVSQGQALYAAERYAEALDPLEKALGLLRENARPTGRPVEATALTEVGRVHRQLGHFQEALSHYRESLALYRDLGDRRGEGIVLGNAGVVYDEIEELQDAKAMFEQAIACFDAIGDDGLRDGARTNLNRLKEEEKDPLRPWRIVEWSVRLFERGAWTEAIAVCEQARSLFHNKHERTGEAGALGTLGVLYQSTGRYQEALESYAAALSAYRDLKDSMGEARTLASLGALYMDLGRTDEATESLEAALRIPRERFNPGDAIIEVTALTNLGTIHMNERRFQEALPFYDKALGIARDLDDEAASDAPTVRKTMRLRQHVANCLSNLGSAHHALGHLDQALDHLEKSLEISREAGERAGEALAENQLGAFRQSQRHPEEASEHYAKARALFAQVGDRHGELVALSNLAVLHWGEGRFDEADRHFAEAVRVLESLRGELPGGQLREGYLATLGSLFPGYAALLIHKGEPERALEAAEQGRARAFLDLLAENRTEIREGVNPRLREAERDLQSQLSALHRQLIEMRSQGQNTAELEEEIRALELRHYTVEAQIRTENPHYAALVLPTIWTLRRIQEGLLDKDTALLDYILADSGSFLFCVSRDDFKVFELPPRAEIETWVQELRAALLGKLPRYPHGHELFRHLIAPAADLIRGKHLLICPDGPLHDLPFSLLLTEPPDEGGKHGPQTAAEPPGFDYRRLPYLIREHAIAYAPSATVAGTVRTETARTRYDAELAAIAAPQNPAEPEAPPTRTGLHAIKRASDEVWALASLFSPNAAQASPEKRPSSFDDEHVSLRTGRAATKTQVMGLIRSRRSFRFYHFAAHGLLDADKPQFSGLAFTPDDEGEPFWRTFEVFNARIPSELVVLSACDTGLGKIVSGEGVVGLTRAFLYAGARAVCVSLWSTAEETSPELMKAFYQAVVAGRTKADALRSAQLQLLDWTPYIHPWWWAPFIIVGDGLTTSTTTTPPG